jgi:6-phosphogluconolactonase
VDHEDSNFRMAREALINHVPVPEDQVHAVATDQEPDEAARSYEATIRTTFGTSEDGTPSFDLVLLGIGEDGHTASLFPQTDVLEVEDRLVAENWVPQQDAMRITFTVPLLQAARSTIVLAAGDDKADAVARAVEGAPNLEETPSQCLRDARGAVIFALDRGAASRLSDTDQSQAG